MRFREQGTKNRRFFTVSQALFSCFQVSYAREGTNSELNTPLLFKFRSWLWYGFEYLQYIRSKRQPILQYFLILNTVSLQYGRNTIWIYWLIFVSSKRVQFYLKIAYHNPKTTFVCRLAQYVRKKKTSWRLGCAQISPEESFGGTFAQLIAIFIRILPAKVKLNFPCLHVIQKKVKDNLSFCSG